MFSYYHYSANRLAGQIKTPTERNKSNDGGAVRVGEMHLNKIDVGEDYCIPPTFRREHQFRITYFELQIRLGIRHSTHPIGLR